MWWSSTPRTSSSSALGAALKEKMVSKIKRGMKIRVVSNTHLILEDTDEWLSVDTHVVQLLFSGHVDIDVFPCSSYETSISGLCVSVSLSPPSFLNRVSGCLAAVVVVSTVLTWSMAMSRLHGLDAVMGFMGRS